MTRQRISKAAANGPAAGVSLFDMHCTMNFDTAKETPQHCLIACEAGSRVIPPAKSFTHQFSHIFGVVCSGYYSYKWAEFIGGRLVVRREWCIVGFDR